jgi:hypothetical protein
MASQHVLDSGKRVIVSRSELFTSAELSTTLAALRFFNAHCYEGFPAENQASNDSADRTQKAFV